MKVFHAVVSLNHLSRREVGHHLPPTSLIYLKISEDFIKKKKCGEGWPCLSRPLSPYPGVTPSTLVVCRSG